MLKNFNEDSNTQPKRLTNVPSFIMDKESYKSKDQSIKSKSTLVNDEEFEQITLSDPMLQNKMKIRMEQWIKGTPKVFILVERSHEVTFRVSSPEKFLLEALKFFFNPTKLQKMYEVIETLFNIVEKYGYFYPEKEMLRISKRGESVVWMHTNLCSLERELPIIDSFISELIFVQKIKSIFAEILNFPKEIENKSQLLGFLESEKNKIPRFLGKLSFPFSKSSKKIDNDACPERREINQFPSYQSISPMNQKHKVFVQSSRRNSKLSQTPSYQDFVIMQDKNKNKTRTDSFRLRKRGKTVNIQNKYCFSDVDSEIATGQSKKNIYDKSISHNSDFMEKVKISEFCLNRHSFNHKSFILNEKAHKIKLFEDTINDELNLEAECHFKPKVENTKKNYRKKSVEENLGHWLKEDCKVTENAFPNSTFSTRVTFSSVRGESEMGDSEEVKKNEAKDNYIIPHIYSVNREKETKEKLTAELRKIMKESGMKISEEDSFENEVDNLFEPEEIEGIEKKKISVRESELATEFEKLFSDSICEDVKSSIIEDFMVILD